MMNKDQIINSIFFPRKSMFPKDENDIIINTSDGEKIAIRKFIKNKNSDTIIFFHGNGEIAHDYIDISTFYNHYDINLIVVDYRGYGLSTGKPNKENLHSDALLAFDSIINYLDDNKYDKKRIIMGRSLGSASACHIIDSRIDKIDGCIIESGFATEHCLLGLMGLNEEAINFTLEDGFENLKKIKNYKKPLYIIHADLDDIVPFSQAEVFLLECPSLNKDLFKVSGANHNNIISIARDDYFLNIKKFIDTNL